MLADWWIWVIWKSDSLKCSNGQYLEVYKRNINGLLCYPLEIWPKSFLLHLIMYENIRVQWWLQNVWTSCVIRSLIVPSFCRLELPPPSYHPICLLWNAFLQSYISALYWKFQHTPLCWVFENHFRKPNIMAHVEIFSIKHLCNFAKMYFIKDIWGDNMYPRFQDFMAACTSFP